MQFEVHNWKCGSGKVKCLSAWRMAFSDTFWNALKLSTTTSLNGNGSDTCAIKSF